MNFKTIYQKLSNAFTELRRRPAPIAKIAANDPKNVNLMDLPEEVLYQILSYLNKRDLDVAKVNRRMHELVNDVTLQKLASPPILDMTKQRVTKTAHLMGKVTSLVELEHNLIACGSSHGIFIVDIISGKVVGKRKIEDVTCVARLPNNKLAVGTLYNILILDAQLNLETTINIWRVKSLLSIADDVIAIGREFSSTQIFNYRTHTEVRWLPCISVDSIQRIAQNLILTKSAYGDVDVFNLDTGTNVNKYKRPTATATVVTALSDTEVAIGTKLGVVYIWHFINGELRGYEISQHREERLRCPASIQKLSAHELLIGTNPGELYLLDLQQGKSTLLHDHKSIYYQVECMNGKRFRLYEKNNVNEIANAITTKNHTHIKKIMGPYQDNMKGSLKNLLALSHFNRKIVSGVNKPDSRLHILSFPPKI